MTTAFEDIAATDAYRRSTDAAVVEVRPEGVVLDRTVFYARGGGQPGDTGWLQWSGGQARVTDTVDPIRVITIEGIDRQADGGTHVRSTGEVGPVRVVKTESKGKAFKRMRIELTQGAQTYPGDQVS